MDARERSIKATMPISEGCESTTSAALLATSVPPAIWIPMSACARAMASLLPSPQKMMVVAETLLLLPGDAAEREVI